MSIHCLTWENICESVLAFVMRNVSDGMRGLWVLGHTLNNRCECLHKQQMFLKFVMTHSECFIPN